MASETKFAAVVVTYNRRDLLLECLKALCDQTRPVDKIFVINNCSSDGTLEALARHQGPVHVTNLSENVGGAGGFEVGIKLAVGEGFDWVWLMDDDAEPHIDCLFEVEKCLALQDAVVLAPVVLRKDGQVDDRVPHRAIMKGRWRATFTSIARSITRQELDNISFFDIDAFSFVGPCIKRDAIIEAGLPLKDFFIHFDDVEYAARLAKLGKAYLVTQALITHKEGQATNSIPCSAFGLKSSAIKYERLWLSYFGFRNMVWLISRKKVPVFRFMIILRLVKLMMHVCIFEDRKLARLRFWTSALVDGLLGNFDNGRPRRLTS